MKKSKLKLGLVTSFICGMALTACNDVTADSKSVVDYKFGDSTISLSTDNMYSDDLETSAGLTKYYEKVRDLLVRATFKDVTTDATNGLSVKTQYNTLVAQAENKVEEQKETARKNAKNNDTSYSDELDAIYESNNVKDEKGLTEKFLLDLEKEQLDSAIMNNEKQLEILRDGNGANEKGWINSAKPYHIKHMLVKVEGGSENFTRATISKDEAYKISKIVTLLASGSKFDDLAGNNLITDDSSDKLGDVGIVNNNATTKSLKMVSEFQLGIYTADALVNHKNSTTALEGIGLDSEIIDGSLKADGITLDKKVVKDTIKVNEVPYSIFEELGQYYELPKDSAEEAIKDVNAMVYPRNVIWNKYLNNHNVFVIVNKKADKTSVTELCGADEYDSTLNDVYKEGSQSGFRDIDGKKYLCAEDGKVIFGVRSEYGIHFIKIQKSAYDADLKTYYPIALKVGDVDVTKQAAGTNYIVGLDNAKDTYDTRLSDIKSAIKSYDSNSEYRLYNFLVSYAKSKNLINDSDETTKKILSKIDNHIADLKASEVYKQDEGLKTVWENYLRLIKLQDDKRDDTWTETFYYGVGGKESYTRSVTALIPEAASDEFVKLCNYDSESQVNEIKTTLAEFAEGGLYYYGK
ncbi:MAG: hypothetical protein J6T15_06055 [Bacilli bacterium]|nr:hypothetical protein [Bacilli bacterium]